MAKSQKRIITKRLETFSPYDFEGSLFDLRLSVENLIKKYGTAARLDWDPRFYEPYDQDPSPKFHVDIQCPETDEEYAARVALENKFAAEQEERERAEFNRLQAKFGAKK